MSYALDFSSNDYNDPLKLAQKLWQFAAAMEEAARRRTEAAQVALDGWEGPSADRFRLDAEIETTELYGIARQAQADACNWAEHWRTQVEYQNWIRREARVAGVKAERSNIDAIADVLPIWDGAVDRIQPLPDVTTPQPPGFWPTARIEDY